MSPFVHYLSPRRKIKAMLNNTWISFFSFDLVIPIQEKTIMNKKGTFKNNNIFFALSSSLSKFMHTFLYVLSPFIYIFSKKKN
jgi:hypothetical protein